MPKFKANTPRQNSHGFVTVTGGINTLDFEKNPVMLYGHDRSLGVIGKWINLQKEGGDLIVEPEFDLEDKFAAEIARKVEKGYLNATSMGIMVKEWDFSTDVAIALQSDLIEISICDLPSNRDAVRLYAEVDGKLELCDEQVVMNLLSSNKAKKGMKNLAQWIALFAIAGINLSAEAGEEELVAEFEKMVTANKNLKADLDKTAAELKAYKDGRIKSLVAKLTGSNAEQKTAIEKLAEVDFDSAEKLVNQLTAVRPTDLIGGNGGAKPEALTFDTLTAQGNDAVEKFKLEKPDEYVRLYKAKFGRGF